MYKSSSSNGNVTIKNRLGVTNDVCVNIIGDIESHFLDKKKVSCSNEVVLIIKSNLEK